MVAISKKKYPTTPQLQQVIVDFAGFQETKKTSVITPRAYWRRGSESNNSAGLITRKLLNLRYQEP